MSTTLTRRQAFGALAGLAGVPLLAGVAGAAPHAVSGCNAGWVCEAHPDKPFEHDGCDGPGMPCRAPGCELSMAGGDRFEQLGDALCGLWDRNASLRDSDDFRVAMTELLLFGHRGANRRLCAYFRRVHPEGFEDGGRFIFLAPDHESAAEPVDRIWVYDARRGELVRRA